MMFLLLGLVSFGCAGDPTAPATPDAPVEPDAPIEPDAPVDGPQVLARLELSAMTILVPGATTQVTVAAFDTDGAQMATPEIAWTSSVPDVAAVSATGEVTASAAGATVITATSGSITAWLRITVAEPYVAVARVELSPDGELVLAAGATSQLLVFAYGAQDQALDGRVITWASSDASVATVAAGGVLVAHAAGTTTITVDCEGVTDTLVVRVPPTVARIQLTYEEATIDVDEPLQLAAQLLDAADQPITGPVTWSSDHPEHASVSPNGLVVGHAEGGAIITAKSGAASATVVVFVARWTERALRTVNGAQAPATLYAYGTTLGGVARDFEMRAEDGVLATRGLDGRYELIVFGPVFMDGEEVGHHSHVSAGAMQWDADAALFRFVPDDFFLGAPFTGRYEGDDLEIVYQPDPNGAPATLVFGG